MNLRRLLNTVFVLGLLVPVSVRVHGQEAASQSKVESGEKSTPAANVPEKKTEEEEAEAYRTSASVEKFGKMLGMNKHQASTAFTLFNLAVLVGAIGWFLARALPKAFKSRNTAIQKNLVDARTATEEATARLNNVEARLSKLDEQIAGMRAQSEADSARDEIRIKANIEEEKKKIVAAAEQEIAAATTHAQREIQKYAAELAIEQAARKLIVSAETDRLLVESFAHRLGGDKGGQN